MVFSKLKKITFILFILFILLFPFWCVKGFCTESDIVNIERVDGVRINPNGNYFISGQSTGYFELDNGYIYHINYTGTGVLVLATSSDVPQINGTYNYLTSLQGPFVYDYISVGQSYLYFDFTQATTSITVTREPVVGMDNAVSGLVDKVGINQIWNVFEDAIPYISVVALFVFGFVIITFVYLKISKGKGGI